MLPPRTRRSGDVIEGVRADIEETLGTSHRRRAQQFGVSSTTMWKILKINLHFFPYKMQLAQH